MSYLSHGTDGTNVTYAASRVVPPARSDGWATLWNRRHQCTFRLRKSAQTALNSRVTTRVPSCLIVEDDQDARDALILFLSISDIKVAAAESRDDALRFLAREVPSVVLMDVWMPGLPLQAFVTELQKLTPPP